MPVSMTTSHQAHTSASQPAHVETPPEEPIVSSPDQPATGVEIRAASP